VPLDSANLIIWTHCFCFGCDWLFTRQTSAAVCALADINIATKMRSFVGKQLASAPIRVRKASPASILPTQRAFVASSSRPTTFAPVSNLSASTSPASTTVGSAGSRSGAGAAAAVFAGLASAATLAIIGNGTNAEAEHVAADINDANEEEGDVSFDGSRFYIPTSEDSKIKIFSGNGNWHLANEISMNLGTQLGRAVVGRHADGEVKVNLLDSVRGQDVYVVQPLASPVNENLMELIFMVTTLRRASARKITAVIPYYGYSRSSQQEGSRSPIASADVAKLLEEAGVDRVITVDLHHAQIQGFFGPSCPVDNLDVSGVAIPYFQTKFLKNPVVISPDANGAARAKSFRDKLIRHGLSASLALIVDHSPAARGANSTANVEDVSEEIPRFDS
jgi:hypothetical protein